MSLNPRAHHTIVEILEQRSSHFPDAPAFTFIEDDNEQTYNYQKLHQQAKAAAQGLSEVVNPGDRVVILCPPGLDYISLLFAGFYAGVIPVPLYPPRLKQRTDRIAQVMKNCNASLIVTTDKLCEPLKAYFNNDQCDFDVRIASMGELVASQGCNSLPAIQPESTAFIQYTSGSTGEPKGVVISHRNIIANLIALTDVTGCNEKDVYVDWLPLFHDLGLIITIMLPLFHGSHSVLMSPASFVQKPVRWLNAIDRYRGTICGAPNFAFDLCTDRVNDAQLQRLDLSSWRIAFNAAEPIDADTLATFANRFAVAGYEPSAMYPAYGMAEATVFVAGGSASQGPVINRFDQEALKARQATPSKKGQKLVGCGKVAPDHRLKIVEPETLTECENGQIGEIWVSGPSIAQGYWQLDELSAATFRATLNNHPETYLRTGDFGFIIDEQLYVSGRIKDIIIIRGNNYFPQDIERIAINSHPQLAAAATAFSVVRDGKEQLVLVQEVKSKANISANAFAMVEAITQAVAVEFELKVEVVLIQPRTLAKTSSGKVQRRLMKQRYLAGKLDILLYDEQDSYTHVDNEQQLTPTQQALLQQWRQVLNIHNIHLDSDFFSLGGDSLDATRVVAWIEKYFAAVLQVETLYDYPTINELAAFLDKHLLELQQEQTLKRHITPVEAEQGPLSFSQQRLWVLNQIEEQSRTLNLSATLQLNGTLNTVNLHRALNTLVGHHEIMRTLYQWDGQQVQQVIQPHTELLLQTEDLAVKDDPLAVASEIAAEEAQQSFDLVNGPVFRVRLLKPNDLCHHLVFTIHHIAADAWSMEVFIKQLSHLYNYPEQRLPAAPVRYLDYAAWQVNYGRTENYQKLAGYWREQLSGVAALTTLPYDFKRPERQTFNGDKFSLPLPVSLTKNLRKLSEQHQTTLFVTLLSAFQIELQRLSGSNDIVVGTDIANRNHGQSADIVGFFVNQLVLRNQPEASQSFEQLILSNRTMVLDAMAHQDMPFEQLVDELCVERSPFYSPLFQVKFLLNQNPFASLKLKGLDAQLVEPEIYHAQYDLTLSIDRLSDDEMVANFHYNTDLFSMKTVSDFAEDYLGILQQVSRHSWVTLRELNNLHIQRSDYVEACQGKPMSYSSSISRKIETAAKSFADHCALICGERNLSYRQLNQQANQLAHFMLDLEVSPGDVVGIHIGRSINQVISLLALNKIGVAFLPLDPEYPVERLEFMLNDSDVEFVLTEDFMLDNLENFSGGLIILDDERSMISEEPDVNPSIQIEPDQLAYVLYTSGSSGQPKGVKIDQDSLHNLCDWYQTFAELQHETCVLQPIPLSFDASIKNILAPLMVGAKVVMPNPGPFDPAHYTRLIATYKVNVINCVPSMIYPVLDEAQKSDYQSLHSLKLLALGGESADLGRIRDWLDTAGSACQIGNIYGPTECTDISVAGKFTRKDLANLDAMPIGSPINNVTAHILDENMQPVPFGVAGELVIGGKGVGLGYIGQAASKNQRFVNKVFEQPGRYYRTGDIVTLERSGLLSYQGRKDAQVKVNGVRIDVGEIESLLQQMAGIEQAVVLQRENRIIAYVLISGMTPPNAQLMREHLRRFLPLTWMPKAFLPLTALPYLPNGKVNRQALRNIPLPETSEPREILPPRHQQDAAMLAIWCEVLKIESFGITDNFFELGGDSMAAVRVVALAQEQGMNLSVADIFERQSIQLLTDGLADTHDTDQPVAESSAFDMLSEEDMALLNALD